MNNPVVRSNFDLIYVKLISLLFDGEQSTNRKGDTIREVFDQAFTLTKPLDCLAFSREFSEKYLKNELLFYAGGSNSVKEASKLSKFWEKCSDDNLTINSNYGRLLFHLKNSHGFTQFEHAINCLKNNPRSKKAVMTLYNNENAYISNDNPCTMYIRLRIDKAWKLHATVCMRSSDIYYGLPYDVPFFIFVQWCALQVLVTEYDQLELGTYTHMANSLHFYESKIAPLSRALLEGARIIQKHEQEWLLNTYNKARDKLVEERVPCFEKLHFMKLAWEASHNSKCLKKKVGACLTITRNGNERLVNAYHGGAEKECKTCAREDDNDPFFGDECPSIHAEMRCIFRALKAGVQRRGSEDYFTLYTTHGPCDACLKLADYAGVKYTFYDKPYKTNYNHWPNITIRQLHCK